METTYTWEVIKMKVLLDVNSAQDVVYNVEFVVTAEKGGIQIKSKEWHVFLPQPKEGSSFIAFDTLTNDIVIEWCKQVQGEEFIKGMYERLNARLDAILSSEDFIEKPLPWAK
jgi:hypothetical protein